MTGAAVSRRDFLFARARRAAAAASARPAPLPPRIEDADCLAGPGSFCAVCRERCPVPGAIRVERGRPRIDPAVCTACGVCADVCPAPRNAIRVGRPERRP